MTPSDVQGNLAFTGAALVRTQSSSPTTITTLVNFFCSAIQEESWSSGSAGCPALLRRRRCAVRRGRSRNGPVSGLVGDLLSGHTVGAAADAATVVVVVFAWISPSAVTQRKSRCLAAKRSFGIGRLALLNMPRTLALLLRHGARGACLQTAAHSSLQDAHSLSPGRCAHCKHYKHHHHHQH